MQTTSASRRILIALTSHAEKGPGGAPTGAYLPEVAHPYAVFTAAGFDVEFASVRGGQVPLDGVSDPDATSAAFLADADLVARLHASAPSSAVDASRYDAIFYAGGHGVMWDLPGDAAFARIAAAIYERGGVVSAVCHGPAALVDVTLSDGSYLVAGKRVSAFTNDEERAAQLDRVVPFLLEDKLRERGARYESVARWQPLAITDARLVTGQNPASATAVAQAVVVALG